MTIRMSFAASTMVNEHRAHPPSRCCPRPHRGLVRIVLAHIGHRVMLRVRGSMPRRSSGQSDVIYEWRPMHVPTPRRRDDEALTDCLTRHSERASVATSELLRQCNRVTPTRRSLLRCRRQTTPWQHARGVLFSPHRAVSPPNPLTRPCAHQRLITRWGTGSAHSAMSPHPVKGRTNACDGDSAWGIGNQRRGFPVGGSWPRPDSAWCHLFVG
jgi:hypothetical protein